MKTCYTNATALEAALKPQYDQQALELCDVCGWKAVIPDDGCLNCQREAALKPGEPVAWVATSKYVVGGVAEVHLSLNKPQGDWFASAMPLFAAPPRREPLTKDEITTLWNQTFGTSKGFVPFARAIEAAHGIGGKE
jgi:hypothetical protein